MRNGMSVPRGGYIPNFAKGLYLTAYSTLLQQFDIDTNDIRITLELGK